MPEAVHTSPQKVLKKLKPKLIIVLIATRVSMLAVACSVCRHAER